MLCSTRQATRHDTTKQGRDYVMPTHGDKRPSRQAVPMCFKGGRKPHAKLDRKISAIQLIIEVTHHRCCFVSTELPNGRSQFHSFAPFRNSGVLHEKCLRMVQCTNAPRAQGVPTRPTKPVRPWGRGLQQAFPKLATLTATFPRPPHCQFQQMRHRGHRAEGRRRNSIRRCRSQAGHEPASSLSRGGARRIYDRSCGQDVDIAEPRADHPMACTVSYQGAEIRASAEHEISHASSTLKRETSTASQALPLPLPP